MSAGRAMKFATSADAAASFLKSYQRRKRKKVRGGGGKRGRGQTAPHVDDMQQEAATPGQSASSAVGNVAEPHRSPPGQRRSGPSSPHSLPHRGVRVARPDQIGSNTLFVLVSLPIATYYDLIEHCRDFKMSPQAFVRQALAAAKLSRGGV